MSKQEPRWVQRLSNFSRGLSKLEEAVRRVEPALGQNEHSGIHEDPFLDDIIKEGVIQRFEYTHELAWNVMKDFLKEAGSTDIYGSEDATRAAFEVGLIEKGDVWMDRIRSRNKTSHTYSKTTADEIFLQIIREYMGAFLAFRDKMQTLKGKRNA